MKPSTKSHIPCCRTSFSLRIRIGVLSNCRNVWNYDKVHKVPLKKWLLFKKTNNTWQLYNYDVQSLKSKEKLFLTSVFLYVLQTNEQRILKFVSQYGGPNWSTKCFILELTVRHYVSALKSTISQCFMMRCVHAGNRDNATFELWKWQNMSDIDVKTIVVE